MARRRTTFQSKPSSIDSDLSSRRDLPQSKGTGDTSDYFIISKSRTYVFIILICLICGFLFYPEVISAINKLRPSDRVMQSAEDSRKLDLTLVKNRVDSEGREQSDAGIKSDTDMVGLPDLEGDLEGDLMEDELPDEPSISITNKDGADQTTDFGGRSTQIAHGATGRQKRDGDQNTSHYSREESSGHSDGSIGEESRREAKGRTNDENIKVNSFGAYNKRENDVESETNEMKDDDHSQSSDKNSQGKTRLNFKNNGPTDDELQKITAETLRSRDGKRKPIILRPGSSEFTIDLSESTDGSKMNIRQKQEGLRSGSFSDENDDSGREKRHIKLDQDNPSTRVKNRDNSGNQMNTAKDQNELNDAGKVPYAKTLQDTESKSEGKANNKRDKDSKKLQDAERKSEGKAYNKRDKRIKKLQDVESESESKSEGKANNKRDKDSKKLQDAGSKSKEKANNKRDKGTKKANNKRDKGTKKPQDVESKSEGKANNKRDKDSKKLQDAESKSEGRANNKRDKGTKKANNQRDKGTDKLQDAESKSEGKANNKQDKDSENLASTGKSGLDDEINKFKAVYQKTFTPKKIFDGGRRIPPVELLPQEKTNSSVRVFLFDDFLSERECDGLMSAHDSHVKAMADSPLICFDSVTTFRRHLEEVDKKVKVTPNVFTPGTTCLNASFSLEMQTLMKSNWSYSTAFYPGESPFSKTAAERIERAMGLKPESGGKFQITSYPTKKAYKTHTDCTLGGSDKRDRVVSVLMYLNTVKDGGETKFPDLGIWVKPKKGRAIVWNNMSPQGVCEPHSQHVASVVKHGSKYILIRWYYYKSFYSLGKRAPPPELPARDERVPMVQCDEYSMGSCRWYDEWNYGALVDYERQKRTLV